MNSSLFWGILLIVIGASLLLKIAFNWDFSIFRVVIAFVLIYFGIWLFIGKDFSLFSDNNNDAQVVFSEKTITHVENGKEYNIAFGGAKFDLRNMDFPDSAAIRIEINTVFGGSQVFLRPDIPVSVKSNTAFAGTKMPNGNTSAFGSLNYENDTAKRSSPRLIIETNTVFGGIQIKSDTLSY